MRGKLILIEGTDCSGKQTQSELLVKNLNDSNINIKRLEFPMYDTPTGKIIGGPYLGKDYICESWFDEGATNVNPKVAALYFAADRLYNIPKINKLLDEGINVILDRYVPSNMAHQGGKIIDFNERQEFYKWSDTLEYELIGLPRPDFSILLYLPHEHSKRLRELRGEKLDNHELSEDHLANAEKAYFEIAKLYNYKIINCHDNNNIRTIKDINMELYNHVIYKLINQEGKGL